MNFRERLEILLGRLEGGMAAVLLGSDGLTVEICRKEAMGLDLDIMSAEIAAIANQLRQTLFVAQFGETKELVLRSGKTTILLYAVTREYFVALVMAPTTPVGKGRYLLQRLEPELVRELS